MEGRGSVVRVLGKRVASGGRCLAALWMAAACSCDAAADCAPPDLPVVTAGDLDVDGRFTGSDVALALDLCDRLGGCVLDLLARTYDDVALLIHQGDSSACTPERTTCSVAALPNGLVIQGRGPDTVLRSPLWTPPYKPQPVIEVRARPDLRIQLRDLVLDGRKQEQRAPTPGVNDHQSWQHAGFLSFNGRFASYPSSQGGCIENVTTRDLFTFGIALGDADDWTIRDNAVHDIGCHDGFTPCPRLDIPQDELLLPGETVSGMGISIGGFVDDLRIEGNVVRRTTKYAIALKQPGGGVVTGIRRPRVSNNQMLDVGPIGLFVAGIDAGWFQDNRIDATHVHGQDAEHAVWFDTAAISCMGRVERTTFFGNELLNSAGIGLNYGCVGDHNRIAQARISGSCQVKNPDLCSPAGNCYGFPDLVVRAEQGSLSLENILIEATDCAAPLGIMNQAGVDLRMVGVQAKQNDCDRIDLDGNGKVEGLDVVAFYGAWQTCFEAGRWIGACDQVDLSKDGTADPADWSEFQRTLESCAGS